MRILGIETSCDETAIGVVEDGRSVLSNVVASQVELHARYGGIVPEVASRQHLLAILPVYQQALSQAGLTPDQIDAVAVTRGPGLAGSLLVGVNFAKGLALAEGLPLLGVNHLEGHVYAAWLEDVPDPALEPGFPMLALIASGGHTDLVLVQGHGQYTLLGRTRDDAAGEAFDKAARVLGLGFPGGPEIQRVASEARGREPMPRPMLGEGLDFSFSGLKTALLRRFQERNAALPGGGGGELTPQLAAGFQEAVVEVLVSKTLEAAARFNARGVLLGGGVAANTLLRQETQRRSPVPVLVPRPGLCIDNGAMIAAAAYFALQRGQRSSLDFDVVPSLHLG
ncbi:MAG: tRNA (adenosine(37)-N6)-threonylcarbamoyltransferase complex transferase subunit TsaD [Chloroflexi bacterium]|nr:tRNA (adenosine(37)-N6)-threonylcarbamoyltransferase complex transferase subunit TsaD [Chloroflexota bacterium]